MRLWSVLHGSVPRWWDDGRVAEPDFSYRPAFGRGLAVAVAVVCAAALVLTLLQDGVSSFTGSLPWLLLVVWLVWAIFWAPEIRVDDAGVHLVNVTRTLHLPWPAIQAVDTKWALTLITRYGKFSAWAAPVSGRRSGREMAPGDLDALPESTFGPGRSIRPGDDPGTPSGKAAMAIRRRLQVFADAGFLDDPKLETEQPPGRWHVESLAVGAGLLLWGLLTVLL